MYRNIFLLSSYFVLFFNIFMAIFLLWKGVGNRLRSLWACVCMAASVWGLGGVIFSYAKTPEEAFWGWQIGYVGVIMAPVFFFHFVRVYLEKRLLVLSTLSYTLAFFFVFLNFFYGQFFIGNVVKTFGDLYWVDWTIRKNPFLLTHYLIYYWGFLPYCYFLLFSKFSKSSGKMRNQIKYFMIGSGLGWIGAEFNFLPDFGVNIFPVSNFLVGFYPFILGYAIIQHKLMDMNVVFKKSLVYSILVAVVTSIYSLLVFLSSLAFQGISGNESHLINILVVFLVALLFNPLKDWIQHFLDQRFFQGTLESLANERHRLQQELFHKEKLAYVGQLASSVVHEIRNPLTAIETFVNYVPDKRTDPEFLKKFDTLVPREISRIKKVVNSLLDISRPAKLNILKLNICAVLDNTLSLLEEQLKVKRIKVMREYDSPEIEIKGDEEQLKQVFLNLFLNAIQAMGEGGTLSIQVKGIRHQTENLNTADSCNLKPSACSNYLQIIVADTGHGILKEDLRKVFSPFYTTKKDGIGLGMSITKEIIENHGGTIEVESKEGDGAKFLIVLPRDNKI